MTPRPSRATRQRAARNATDLDACVDAHGPLTAVHPAAAGQTLELVHADGRRHEMAEMTFRAGQDAGAPAPAITFDPTQPRPRWGRPTPGTLTTLTLVVTATLALLAVWVAGTRALARLDRGQLVFATLASVPGRGAGMWKWHDLDSLWLHLGPWIVVVSSLSAVGIWRTLSSTMSVQSACQYRLEVEHPRRMSAFTIMGLALAVMVVPSGLALTVTGPGVGAHLAVGWVIIAAVGALFVVLWWGNRNDRAYQSAGHPPVEPSFPEGRA